MGNSLIQIVAVGPQNVVLNANPEGTLFKGFYRRITMFAIESIPQNFTGSVGFGNKVTATISRNGDLLTKMVLEVTLPGLSSDVGEFSAYVNDIGHHLLKEIELEVGGISVVKHYGRWLQIWQELTRPAAQDATYNKMIGNRAGIVQSPTAPAQAVTANATGGKLYIPLKFWFCNNYSLAFPLIACQYHDVKVNLTFASLSEVTRSTAGVATANATLDATLYVDYVFLDNDERRNFATNAHEYLIEELQYPSAESHSGQTTVIRRLDGFNHPVKEIVWVVQKDSLFTGATRNLSDFSDSDDQMVTSAKLQLNGNDRFQERDGNYFNWVQPNQHHTRGPSTGIYVYSFATEPEKHQPTGTCNFSRIDTAQLQLTLNDTASSKSHVYMVNYNVGRFVSGMFGKAYAA
jgi:hypothetical protein